MFKLRSIRAFLSKLSTFWRQRATYTFWKSKDPQKFYENYFSLIASGARLKLIEAMFSLNLFALFAEKAYLLESEIIDRLDLMPIRAKKWLHLLSSEEFLIKTQMNEQTAYRLPDEFIELIQSEHWWAMRFFFNSWQYAAEENLTEVLRYGEVKTPVSWPPKTNAEVQWLENWMMNTAEKLAQCLLEQIRFTRIRSFLDVGGGDGTIACALTYAYPHLRGTVYNLPKSAAIARKTIAEHGLSEQLSVYEGDFIKEDQFQPGFDLILFNRVLFDWDASVNKKLLAMAYQALPEKGLLAICEFYKDEDPDRCLASEYRYIFHDGFSPAVMKSAADYRKMLTELGFKIISNKRKKPQFNAYSLILAEK